MAMRNTAQGLSLRDIDRMRDRRLKEIASLEKKRDRLQRQVDRLDAQLSELRGDRRRGRPRATAIRRRRRRRRVRNRAPLGRLLVDILAKTSRPLRADELLQGVTKSGYKSSSKNLRGMIYQAISKSPKIASAKNGGGYVLKK